MLPDLARAFPDRIVVLRPHPVEGHEIWHRAAQGLPNVRVIHEGSVLPWLLAASVLVHNGCTTGVESFALGRPAVSYRPVVSEDHDLRLPNALGYRADSLPELVDVVRGIVERGLSAPADPAQHALLAKHLTALDGPLASDRIADALGQHLRTRAPAARRSLVARVSGVLQSEGRAVVKRAHGLRPDNENNPSYQRHRYPGVTKAQLEARIAELGRALGRFGKLDAKPIGPQLFEIRS
jgi:hypothetical protein